MSRPFKNGKIDEAALERLIRPRSAAGVDGIVPVGTTGESPTVDYEEHIHIIALSVKFAARPDQGARRHGRQLHQRGDLPDRATLKRPAPTARSRWRPITTSRRRKGSSSTSARWRAHTRLPIVLYSIPGRCGIEIGVDTVKRLAQECKNIIGIKEAGGNADRVSQLRAALGPRFEILSGDDSLTLPFMAVGAQGVISVASNVIPRQVAQMVKAFAAGKTQRGPEAPPEVLSAVQRPVHRDQPGAGQSRAGDAGPDRRGISPAAGADERQEPRGAAGDYEGRGVLK